AVGWFRLRRGAAAPLADDVEYVTDSLQSFCNKLVRLSRPRRTREPSGALPGALRGEAVVRLGQQRDDEVAERRVARVEDRDPVLRRVHRVREEPVDRRVDRVTDGADESIERLPTRADVQAEDPRPREVRRLVEVVGPNHRRDRKSTRLNSSHEWISYAVFCL